MKGHPNNDGRIRKQILCTSEKEENVKNGSRSGIERGE
jgi:hypothetical protein